MSLQSKYKFIVFEGFDGVGKTTLSKWFAEKYGFIYLKSPMGAFAKAREYFDQPGCDIEDRFAFYAGDCIRMSMRIEKLLLAGEKIILDRYYYSTIAYQEAKMPGVSISMKKLFEKLVQPDLVILLLSDFEIVKSRLRLKKDISDQWFLSQQNYNSIYSQYKQLISGSCIEVSNNESLNRAKDLIGHILLP